MPTNHYFQSGVPMGRRSEQNLYEDLIIECLRIYGHYVYYVPRKKFNQDLILNEDVLNSYEHAYPIEMYLENVQGFEGEGELLSKFGVELRDTATFVVSRRRWSQLVNHYGQTILDRPAEGDVVYFPQTKSIFEIRKVIGNQPFYQAGALYVYKLSCELMQYSLENFDTGVTEIDGLPDAVQDQLLTSNYELTLENAGALLTEFDEPIMLENYNTDSFTLQGETITDAQNLKFDTDIDDILDFTERNPFGEVARA
jgi:Virus neck protein